MYTDCPTQWVLENFANPADRRECARQFLILQAKKVRSDLSDKAKASAAQAVAKRAKGRAAPTATPASPGSPGSPATPRTATAPATTGNPRTSRNPVATRSPATATAPATTGTPRAPRNPVATRSPPAIRSPLATSSPLATRRPLTTRGRARNDDDEAEVPGSPPAKRPRQVELPELRFTAFSVSFHGPDSTRTHSTTYASVNEFPRLVRQARSRAPQLSTKSMPLKPNITLRNDE